MELASLIRHKYYLNTFYLKKTLNAFFQTSSFCVDNFEETTRSIGLKF